MERTACQKTWAALIVTKEDGTEVCLFCISGFDVLSNAPMDNLGPDSTYLQELVKKQGDIKSYRVESTTREELIERGYREAPII